MVNVAVKASYSHSTGPGPTVGLSYLNSLGVWKKFTDVGFGIRERVQREEFLQVCGGVGASMGSPEKEHAIRAVCYLRIEPVGSCEEVRLRKGSIRVRLGSHGIHEGTERLYLLDNETAHAVRHEENWSLGISA